MVATTLNLPLYRVLTELKVPEERAREAAEASIPDLSGLVTKDDLKSMLTGMEDRFTAALKGQEDRSTAALKGVEDRIARLVAERADSQTKWFTIVGFSGIGLVLSAIGLSFVVSNFLLSPNRLLPPQPQPPALSAPASPR